MITEDYVSFEIAKLLKEKRFDCNTNCYYIENSVTMTLCYSPIKENHNASIENNELDVRINISSGKMSAPTLQMARKWLREEHNIYIDVLLLNHDYEGNYGYVIQNTTTKDYLATSKNNSYNTCEEAAEEAIKYCLENLI